MFSIAAQFMNFDTSDKDDCQVWKLLTLRYSNGEVKLSYSQAMVVIAFVRYFSTLVV